MTYTCPEEIEEFILSYTIPTLLDPEKEIVITPKIWSEYLSRRGFDEDTISDWDSTEQRKNLEKRIHTIRGWSLQIDQGKSRWKKENNIESDVRESIRSHINECERCETSYIQTLRALTSQQLENPKYQDTIPAALFQMNDQEIFSLYDVYESLNLWKEPEF